MNILLVDPFPPQMLAKIQLLGHPFRYEPDWTKSEVLAHLGEVDILVMNSKVNADRELLAHGPRLKMVCRAGVGMDHFDLPLLESRGIVAFNTPGANAIPVAEQAVGMLLCLMHNIARADREVHAWQWLRERNRGTELHGKTVGIIGHGNTGGALGRCLSGFGCRVLAYDKYKTGFGTQNVEEVGLEQIFESADILSLHIPLTDETNGWVDASFFSRFKKPIWFLNLSRGPIVPLSGLIDALESGNVIAAGLDVLENEKLASLSPEEKGRLESLFGMDRVVFTPHIGGWSHESLDRINDRIVEGIEDFLSHRT
ncbi:MAG TPA: NAD(P)-dependent oxidoreductase [Bacteroidia bacterium]|nr:NAD(P)-dependent oxidoreductase [Bacteroidia bacterium]